MIHLYLWPLSHDSVACRHFHDNTSWKSLNVIEKTPNLEDLYLEFCHSVWPHLCTVGKVFQLAKTFQKTPKSENAQKYPKNEFFCLYVGCLKANPRMIRELLSFVPADVKGCSYTWLAVLETHIYFLYPWLSSYATHGCLLKISKNMPFEFRLVWVVMQLTSSVVTTLSWPLTLPLAYK